MLEKIYPLVVAPGIKRDGTLFSNRHWTDGKWVRFQRGLPRKMYGYKELATNFQNVPRKVFVYPNTSDFDVYIGDYESIKYLPIDQFGSPLGGLVDRTPLLFNANQNNTWTIDTMFSTVSSSNTIIAHAGQNLSNIDSSIETPIYYGDTSTTSRLIETGVSVSGGICVLHPFLFMFGNAGDVKWSMPNDPTTVMDDARVTGSKIIAGNATRGGNSSPAGLLWSLDSLIRVTQVGTSSIQFSFDTVTDESSILSSSSIIEYNGIYYWCGINSFLVYNGTVQELPNDLSINFFFDNLNYAQKQKVWATKVTRFNEIWWFFPKGNNTECNHALIYNIKVFRSAGFYTQVFPRPIWTSNQNAPYGVYIHETGYNAVDINNTPTAIQSYIESSDISWCSSGPDGQANELDRIIYLYRVEPDFIQSGNMNMIVNGKEYARSPNVQSQNYQFSATTEKIDLREQRREMRLKFESNVVDGFFEMGKVLYVARVGDERP
jgi:hypothetical protein